MNRIKEVLELRNMSQTMLAELLGKSFNMVNLYATNKVQPPIPTLYKIAEILKVDVRELLTSSILENNHVEDIMSPNSKN
jgi:putative transcriptional regulator